MLAPQSEALDDILALQIGVSVQVLAAHRRVNGAEVLTVGRLFTIFVMHHGAKIKRQSEKTLPFGVQVWSADQFCRENTLQILAIFGRRHAVTLLELNTEISEVHAHFFGHIGQCKLRFIS